MSLMDESDKLTPTVQMADRLHQDYPSLRKSGNPSLFSGHGYHPGQGE